MSAVATDDSLSSNLLSRIKARDADAWERLATLFGPLVYQWCRGAGLQTHDASDIVQDVFRGVLQGIDTFQRDRPQDSFRGWLWTITRNRIRDHFRRHKAQPQASGGTDAQAMLVQVPDLPAEESSESLQRHPDSAITHSALQLVRSEFEVRTWDAFWKTAVEGQKPADVAADLGMSVAAVYMAKSRVFRRLRSELEGLMDQL
jgi:RNA polymerase sigma-70 factor (ECF subfamily)